MKKENGVRRHFDIQYSLFIIHCFFSCFNYNLTGEKPVPPGRAVTSA
jgi:hypothetical protein